MLSISFPSLSLSPQIYETLSKLLMYDNDKWQLKDKLSAKSIHLGIQSFAN